MNISLLKQQGWNIITIWECELKSGRSSQTLEGLKESLFSLLG